jgi:hypothetical protein
MPPLSETTVHSPQDNMALALKVGELDGKLSAVTERQSRHETWVGAKLDSMDNKLDAIAVSLANSAGRSDLIKSLTNPAMWLVGSLASVAAWFVTHFIAHH